MAPAALFQGLAAAPARLGGIRRIQLKSGAKSTIRRLGAIAPPGLDPYRRHRYGPSP